jgi:hypothetical protein
MEHLIANIVFGHFVGDFFLQHKLMAENKFLKGWKSSGWCALHVLVYTITVAVFVGNFSPIFLLGVALPHFVADRFSFAYQWMRLIGRGDLMGSSDPGKASFGTTIYVVIDQTFHLGCLYLLMQAIN